MKTKIKEVKTGKKTLFGVIDVDASSPQEALKKALAAINKKHPHTKNFKVVLSPQVKKKLKEEK